MMLKTFALFALTALAEIVGCWLPWLWLRKGGSVWLLLPAALSLALFAWLLTLHPTASGRTYAAYGGVSMSAPPWRGCGWWTASVRHAGMCSVWRCAWPGWLRSCSVRARPEQSTHGTAGLRQCRQAAAADSVRGRADLG